MTRPKRRSECPVSSTLDLIGDKWSLIIIRDLMFLDKKTYGDFLNSEEKIATNILADRLAMLENAGLIKGKKDKAHKLKTNYSLTEKGLDLAPVLLEIVMWGVKHFTKTNAPDSFVERIKKDRENYIKEIKSRGRSV